MRMLIVGSGAVLWGCSFEPAQLPELGCLELLTIDSPGQNQYFAEGTTAAGRCATDYPVVLSGDIAESRTLPCDDGQWTADVVLSGPDGAKEIRAEQALSTCKITRRRNVFKTRCVGEVVERNPYSGTGDPDDPFVICTASQLQAVAQRPLDLGGTFVLGRNIDLSGIDWLPIGNLVTPFSGVFDGQGFRISKLVVRGGLQPAGLFGAVAWVGAANQVEIANLALVNVDAEGAGETGALAGWVNDAFVHGIVLDGVVVRGNVDAGGLVGYGTALELSSIDATDIAVSGVLDVGGLVGWHDGGILADALLRRVVVSTYEYGGGALGDAASDVEQVEVRDAIVSCAVGPCGGVIGNKASGYTSGVKLRGQCNDAPCVDGQYDIGGLVGNLTGDLVGGSVEVSGNAAAVAAQEGSVGGAVGYVDARGAVQDTWSNGVVSAPSAIYVGGLAGETAGPILRCAATGLVDGLGWVGGLVGLASATEVTESMARGDVHGHEGAVGGLVGLGVGATILDSYAVGSVSSDQTDNPLGYYVGMGGILGVMDTGDVDRCLFAGEALVGAVGNGPIVGKIEAGQVVGLSYWRSPLLRPTENDNALGGLPLTSEEMRIEGSFTGWTFPQTWVMGSNHPVLAWE